jgi:hypothetical protein
MRQLHSQVDTAPFMRLSASVALTGGQDPLYASACVSYMHRLTWPPLYVCVSCTHRSTWPPSAFLQHLAVYSAGQVTFTFHRSGRFITVFTKGRYRNKSNSPHIFRICFYKIDYSTHGSYDSPLLMRSSSQYYVYYSFVSSTRYYGI